MLNGNDSRKTSSELVTLLVLASVLALGIGQSMTFALLAPLGREAGLLEIQVGLIITCGALTNTLMGPVWGRACDRVGRKPILLVSMCGYAFGCSAFATMFLLGFAGVVSGLLHFVLIILSRVMMAFLISAGPSAAAGYIADTTTAEQRISGMGKLGSARTLGAIFGPAFSSALAIWGLLAPLYIAALIALAGALLIALTLKEPRHETRKPRPRRKLKWLDKRYRLYVVTGVLTYISFSMMSQTIGFFLQDRFVLSGQETAHALGTGLTIAALTTFFSQSFLVNRLKKKPKQLIATGLPILILGYALLPVVSSLPLAFLVLGLLGSGLGLITPAYTAGASLAVGPEEQGSVGGIIAACPAAGFIVGPLLGTSSYQLHPSLPYFFASLIIVLLLIYVLKSGIRTERP